MDIVTSSYDWVMKNIEGSTTQWHFKVCAKIIGFFEDQYRAYPTLPPKLWAALRERAHAHGCEVPYNDPN